MRIIIMGARYTHIWMSILRSLYFYCAHGSNSLSRPFLYLARAPHNKVYNGNKYMAKWAATTAAACKVNHANDDTNLAHMWVCKYK